MSNNTYSTQTRERIIDAAHKTFSNAGYDGTSVRQIVALAGTNIASVNYHFGSKEALYREVVETTFDWLSKDFDQALELIAHDDFHDDFHKFTRQRILEGLREKAACPPRLIGWEIVSPTLDIKELMERRLMATEEKLAVLLAPLFGPDASAAQKIYAARWFFTFITPPPHLIEGFWKMLGPDPDEKITEQAVSHMADAAIDVIKTLTASPLSATDPACVKT